MAADAILRFVLHEHSARHHHYDFRLEYDGVLKSWAVPKGLPEKPGDRRLAIETEDHPLEYIGFTGTIPEGEYGAGKVTIADTGDYEPLVWTLDRIECILRGSVFTGKYVLVRFKKAGEKEWLVMKVKDSLP
jgi:bifunctional non-homologous end joining protein LigD